MKSLFIFILMTIPLQGIAQKTFFIQVSDLKHKGISGIKVTVKNAGTQLTDNEGYVNFRVKSTLEPIHIGIASQHGYNGFQKEIKWQADFEQVPYFIKLSFSNLKGSSLIPSQDLDKINELKWSTDSTVISSQLVDVLKGLWNERSKTGITFDRLYKDKDEASKILLAFGVSQFGPCDQKQHIYTTIDQANNIAIMVFYCNAFYEFIKNEQCAITEKDLVYIRAFYKSVSEKKHPFLNNKINYVKRVLAKRNLNL